MLQVSAKVKRRPQPQTGEMGTTKRYPRIWGGGGDFLKPLGNTGACRRILRPWPQTDEMGTTKMYQGFLKPLGNTEALRRMLRSLPKTDQSWIPEYPRSIEELTSMKYGAGMLSEREYT